ncbi:DUF6233 domain-containing protein [Streptomyces sp. NPDC002990]
METRIHPDRGRTEGAAGPRRGLPGEGREGLGREEARRMLAEGVGPCPYCSPEKARGMTCRRPPPGGGYVRRYGSGGTEWGCGLGQQRPRRGPRPDLMTSPASGRDGVQPIRMGGPPVYGRSAGSAVPLRDRPGGDRGELAVKPVASSASLIDITV